MTLNKNLPGEENHYAKKEPNVNWEAILATRELQPTSSNGYKDFLSSKSESNKMLWAAGSFVAGVSILVGLQFPFLFPKSAPYMATPGRKIRDALQFLNKTGKSETRTIGAKAVQRVFVDLGSGDGQAVYEAARLGYQAIGIEFNWTLWAFASLRRQLFWTSKEKRLSTLLRQDYHSYNLEEADTIMIFAVPRTMPILGSKIQRECKPGTDILSYRFGIPLASHNENQNDFTNVEDKCHNRLNANLIYDREDMRIYRKKKR